MTQHEDFQVDRFLRKQAAARMALNATKTFKMPTGAGAGPRGFKFKPTIVPPRKSTTPGWSGPAAGVASKKSTPGFASGVALGGAGVGGAALVASRLK